MEIKNNPQRRGLHFQGGRWIFNGIGRSVKERNQHVTKFAQCMFCLIRIGWPL